MNRSGLNMIWLATSGECATLRQSNARHGAGCMSNVCNAVSGILRRPRRRMHHPRSELVIYRAIDGVCQEVALRLTLQPGCSHLTHTCICTH
jgi:hypothetical protein